MGKRRSKLELISYAIETNHTKDIRKLLSNGFNIDSRDNVFKPNTEPMTLLCFAVSLEAIDVVLTLIDMGANINTPTLSGDTPIHIAIRSIKPPSKDPSQHRSIDVMQALIRLLIYYGADVSACNCVYETPLHIAARLGEAKVVNILLDNGADVTRVCNEGFCAYDVCQQEIKKILPDNTSFNPIGRLWTGVIHTVQLNRYNIICDLLETARIRELEFQQACITELLHMRQTHSTKVDRIEDMWFIFHELRQHFLPPSLTTQHPKELFEKLISEGYLNAEPDVPRVFPLKLSNPL